MKRKVHVGPRTLVASGVLTLGLALVIVAVLPLGAQTAISADGVVESTSGGFKFPDGSVQMTAASPASAPVADTGQQGCWDATGTEIACSGTGQDGELQRGVDWPSPRFTDNGDGTVTDNLTGLIWLQEANCFGSRTWEQALSDVDGLMPANCGLSDGSVAGDWRLPNIKELLSLLDYGEETQHLPLGHPFTDASDIFWSSTTNAKVKSQAWAVSTTDGGFVHPEKTTSISVWPVRGGE